ncbi:cytochrome P450 [Luteolibacter flavescens]|uniref:Cytochrome P450 n=1 Tax=Luteolibacter flavescens TaxID=1859460 RepID=A0ABT3FWK5_9BACT|nr:cytochrome P450 [Luteolibacter flavescens]MCW1887365.1 cytochrome P450 [Luteolibacter flavescens]
MKPPVVDSPRHWLLGSAYYLRYDPQRWVPEWARRYNGLFMVQVPFVGEAAVVTSPELARRILVTKASCYQKKSRSYGVLRILMGDGLVTSEGALWKTQRKLVQPAFHPKRLDAIFSMKVDRTLHMLDELDEAGGSDTVVDLVQPLSRLTLDIISRAMFSSDSQGMARDVSDHIATLNEWALRALRHPWMLLLPRKLPLPFFSDMQRSLAELERIVHDLIRERREHPGDHDDLLSMLLAACEEDSGRGMSDAQLRDEVMTMYVAGHETTANAMAWILYLVSSHPEIEKRLHDEIDAHFPEGELRLEDLASFPYVRQVIDESLRLYPTIWSVGRCCTEAHELGGYHIAEGTNVLIPTFHFHWNEEAWENPRDFDPDRFSPERRPPPDSPHYFPFGAGPRGCVGNHFALQELMIMTILFHRRFRFRVEEGFKVEGEFLITLRPKHGMRMVVSKRTPQAPMARSKAAAPLTCPYSGGTLG